MSRLVKSMRNGLVALLACLPLVASGAGGAAPASGDPDAALGAVFKDIERSRLSDALDKVDALIARYPNFRLAHLIKGDLLLARRQPIDTLPYPPVAATDCGAPGTTALIL